MSAPPAELVANVRTAHKKGIRAIVESLREVALLSAPAPPLFPSLLSLLQTLRCNRKAGEENKAVRHCYQYISWLAASGLLDEGGALTVLHQLARIDLRDELIPRRLAALQLFAEISVHFPGAAGALLRVALAVRAGCCCSLAGCPPFFFTRRSPFTAALLLAHPFTSHATPRTTHPSPASHVRAHYL